MNPECRLAVKSFFLLTKDLSACYVGRETDYGMLSHMITDQSQTAARSRAPLRPQDPSVGQRSLVELMHEHQFGRIENMSVRAGEPVITSDIKVVRVARLGGRSDAVKVTRTDEFELKRQVRDLFRELDRLQDGTVILLEFRHGLPFLLETTRTCFLADRTATRGSLDTIRRVKLF